MSEETSPPDTQAHASLWWNAFVRGTADDFSAAVGAMDGRDAALADPAWFATLARHRRLLGAAGLDLIARLDADEPGCVRSAEVLYLEALPRQADPALLRAINASSCAIERATMGHRVRLDGREMAPHEVRGVLRAGRDTARRAEVWESSRALGPRIAGDFVGLVGLRNRAARQVGFPDFRAMHLHLEELDARRLAALFDDLDALTRGPYLAAKAGIDARLARACGIGPGDLRPWHYHDEFAKRAPAADGVDLDAPYRGADIPRLCGDFYAGIGLPLDDVLARSDLHERPGKGPHAFCTDLDREGDIRVLADIAADEASAGCLLHELGHAAYFKNIGRGLPRALRTHAHSLVSEGAALLFERLSTDGGWLRAMGVRLDDPAAFAAAGARRRRDDLLFFARWSLVVFRFEAAMYADPGRDLDTLWWDLVEEYQGIRRPGGLHAPDWACSYHIINRPCDYHNYMLGELLAAQLHRTIAREVLGGVEPSRANYAGRAEVGRFLVDRVFAPGNSLRWDALIRQATGSDLAVDAFAAEIAIDMTAAGSQEPP